MASLFNCDIHLFIQLCNFAVLKSSQSKFTTTAASAAVMCCFCLYVYCRLLYVLTELYINVSASLIEFLLHMNYISSVFEIDYNYTAIQYRPCLLYTNIDQTLVNSLYGLLNCEIDALDCHVITTAYETRVHGTCIHM